MTEDLKEIYQPAMDKHWKLLHADKRELLGSHNLKDGERIVATVRDIKWDQEVKGKSGRVDTVTFIYFDEINIPMCLNVTNCEVLAKLYGDTPNDWIGKRIEIFSGQVKNPGGKGTVPGLCFADYVPVGDEDLSDYKDKLSAHKTVAGLGEEFKSMPKHVQGQLAKFTGELKTQLEAEEK